MHRFASRTAAAAAAAALALGVASVTVVCAARPARAAAAQEGGAGTAQPPPPAQPVFDRQAVFTDIYHLNLLASLAPLKLTAPQRDRILAALKSMAAEDKERRAKDEDALRALAPEVARAKAAALAGEAVPAEITTRMEEAGKAADARAAQARRVAVARLLPILREALTDAQKDEIDRQSVVLFGGKRVPAKYRSNPGEAPRAEVLDLSMTAFIERVFLDEAMLDLLPKLKAAPDADAGAGD